MPPPDQLIDWPSWLEQHAPPVPEHAKTGITEGRRHRRLLALQRLARALGSRTWQGFLPWTDPETGEHTHRWGVHEQPAITSLDELCALPEHELAWQRGVSLADSDIALLAACLENAGRHLDEPAHAKRPPPVDHAKRNASIVAAIAAGATRQALAEEHGISYARVMQILHKHQRIEETRRRLEESKRREEHEAQSFQDWLCCHPLSVRTCNVFEKSGISSLAQLCALREIDLLRLPNFGRKCLKEVKEALAEDGLKLSEVEPPPPGSPLPSVPLPVSMTPPEGMRRSALADIFELNGREPLVVEAGFVIAWLRDMAVELRDRRSELYDRELGPGAARGGHRALMAAAAAFENTFPDPWRQRRAGSNGADPHAAA